MGKKKGNKYCGEVANFIESPGKQRLEIGRVLGWRMPEDG